MRIEDDKFRIFISHKHQDSELAETMMDTLQGLDTKPEIDCFVSGIDIVAGMDWNRTIKRELARSHMLILLFTKPTLDWDWCLYEAGLFTQFGSDDVLAVVAMYADKGRPPRPISNIQGTVATPKSLELFLGRMVNEPWRMTDDWRRGPIANGDISGQIKAAAMTISDAFERCVNRSSTPGDIVYYPCHRVVLDLAHIKDTEFDGIPMDARVVEGPDATSAYTLSLFGVAEGRKKRSWVDLVELVGGSDSDWRAQLDEAFRLGHKEMLFTPIKAAIKAWDPIAKEHREYRPMLYRVVSSGDRVVGITIVLDRVLEV